MMNYTIVHYPNQILLSPCNYVPVVNDTTRTIFTIMEQAMNDNNGIGIAANQIGIPLQMMIVKYGRTMYRVVNPELTIWDATIIEQTEGCLSFPDKEVKTGRYKEVQIKGLDEYGKSFDITVKNELAVIFQHEFDHCVRGKTMLDREIK